MLKNRNYIAVVRYLLQVGNIIHLVFLKSSGENGDRGPNRPPSNGENYPHRSDGGCGGPHDTPGGGEGGPLDDHHGAGYYSSSSSEFWEDDLDRV